MRIRLGCGLLTEFKTDAYVIIATGSLEPVGHDGADVHRAAGPRLVEQCRDLAPVERGTAIVTSAFGLTPVQWVVHLVVDPEVVSMDPGAGAAAYVTAVRCADAAGARLVTMQPLRQHGTDDNLYDAAADALDALQALSTDVTDLALAAPDRPRHSA